MWVIHTCCKGIQERFEVKINNNRYMHTRELESFQIYTCGSRFRLLASSLQLVHDLYIIAHAFYGHFRCNEFENSYSTTTGNFGNFAFEFHKQIGAGLLSKQSGALRGLITKGHP